MVEMWAIEKCLGSVSCSWFHNFLGKYIFIARGNMSFFFYKFTTCSIMKPNSLEVARQPSMFIDLSIEVTRKNFLVLIMYFASKSIT
jgi:hypothetical protein